MFIRDVSKPVVMVITKANPIRDKPTNAGKATRKDMVTLNRCFPADFTFSLAFGINLLPPQFI
jgi:hypothetical protein